MRIVVWSSKIGATVYSGRLIFQVWEHGGTTHLVRDDATLTGFRGTHYSKVPKGTFEEMAKAAIESWKNDRSAWSECE